MGEGGGGEAPCGGSYSYRPPRCNGYGHAGTYIHTDIKINTSTYFVRGTGGPQDAQVVILAPVAMRMRVAFTHAISSAAVGGAARGGVGRGGAGRARARPCPRRPWPFPAFPMSGGCSSWRTRETRRCRITARSCWSIKRSMVASRSVSVYSGGDRCGESSLLRVPGKP